MITTYTIGFDTPIRTDNGEKGKLPSSGWIDLAKPSYEECSLLHQRFGIPLDHLYAALDHNERPRLEYANGTLLLIARSPTLDSSIENGPLATCPIAVIVKDELIVTVCLKSRLTQELLSHKLPGTHTRPTVRLLLALLMRVSTAFINQLYLMDEHVSRIENTLQKSMQNQELIKILHVEKSLIYFLTALKSNHAVLDKIRSGSYTLAGPGEHELLDDVLIENKQATDMASIYTEIMGSISDAFGAIVSNNLNKVMKLLTGMTVVVMVPSIVGALYGMNVSLPWQENPYAFIGLCALCIGLSFLVFYIFRKKNWM